MTAIKNRMQQGFSLITAIFLLVVVAGLGALMMTFFTAQQQGSALDAVGGRANQAARAGIEWGAFQIVQSGVAGGTFASNCQTGPVSSPVTLPGTLSGFNVDVWCSATAHSEVSATITAYSISSVAVTQGATPGQPDYVERVTQAVLWQ